MDKKRKKWVCTNMIVNQSNWKLQTDECALVTRHHFSPFLFTQLPTVILFGQSEMSFMCFVFLCGKVFAAAFSACEVRALLKKFFCLFFVFPLLLFLTFSVLLFRVSCMWSVAVYFCPLSEITLNLIFTASARGS